MVFERIASTKDLQPGKMLGVEAKDKKILLVNLSDEFYSIGNSCMHKGCKLSNGTLIDGKVQCPCHGSVYDVRTGALVNGPSKKPEPSFKVKIDGDDILVDL